MASESAYSTVGSRARYYQLLFLAAAVWNALSAGAVLFLLTRSKFREVFISITIITRTRLKTRSISFLTAWFAVCLVGRIS
jgi:hypothetical protein